MLLPEATPSVFNSVVFCEADAKSPEGGATVKALSEQQVADLVVC